MSLNKLYKRLRVDEADGRPGRTKRLTQEKLNSADAKAPNVKQYL